jgi:hypothetical protein
MTAAKPVVSSEEKQRLREEIRCQVEDFLKRGGRIDVLDTALSPGAKQRASIWHGQEIPNDFMV